MVVGIIPHCMCRPAAVEVKGTVGVCEYVGVLPYKDRVDEWNKVLGY